MSDNLQLVKLQKIYKKGIKCKGLNAMDEKLNYKGVEYIITDTGVEVTNGATKVEKFPSEEEMKEYIDSQED